MKDPTPVLELLELLKNEPTRLVHALSPTTLMTLAKITPMPQSPF